MILDDDHSNIHIFACPRDSRLPNSSHQVPESTELLSIEHVLSIPVYQYAQVSLIPTIEKDIASISLLINESMLIVVDRCGGLLRLYTEDTVGYAFAEVRNILRLTETHYILFTATDVVDLDLGAHVSHVYADVGNVQVLHMCSDPATSIDGPVLNINLKYVYGPVHLYLLAMVSNDIYILKIYSLETRRLICQIYFYERVVSLQELPGAGHIVITDIGKIYQVHLYDNKFLCSNVVLKNFNLTQNIEKFLVLSQYAAIETETRFQYLYSVTWEPGVLTFTHLLWSDDASLASSMNIENTDTINQSKNKFSIQGLFSRIAALYSTPDAAAQQTPAISEFNTDTAISPSVISSTKRVLNTSYKASFGPKSTGVLSDTLSLQSTRSYQSTCDHTILKNLAIQTSNNTNVLLFILNDGFILSSLSEASSNGSGFIIREEAKVIFSEVLSALIGHDMPLNAILNVTILKDSNYGFVFRLQNFSTGSSFEFPFISTNLVRILHEADHKQPIFRAYSVFSVDDYIVTWLLASNVCFGFYLSFRTRICLTAEFHLEGDVYFSYPLVRLLYKTNQNNNSSITAQHILTYYVLEIHTSTDVDYEELGSQAVTGQRTLMSLFVSTRTHILTEFNDSTFQITETATITPVSVQYEMILQEQSKLLRAMVIPYLILSNSSFILITETSSETCFYLFAFDVHRGTAEVSLLEHDIALAFLCDHNDLLCQFGYLKMETFHLSGLIDFYISGILRKRLKDKVAKDAMKEIAEPIPESQKSRGRSLSKSNSSPAVASVEFSDILLKGTIESFLMHRQSSKDPEVSVVGTSTLHHIFEDIPADAYPITSNGTLASMNDQIEKLVIDKQYNPYVSLTAAKKHKKVRRDLYCSVDNDVDISDDALSESSNTRSHALSAQSSCFRDDGMTSIVSLKKKLDIFKKSEGYAGEYAIQPMKARVSRFLRLCISISSTTSKQSMDYRAELGSVDTILRELAISPRLDYASGTNVSFSVPMTPDWINMMISQFSLKYPTTGSSIETPASPQVQFHGASTVISELLQQECDTATHLLSSDLHEEQGCDNDDNPGSEESISSHVGDVPRPLPRCATLVRMLSAMRSAAVSSEPGVLEAVVESYLPANYFSLDSLGFLQIYNSTQKVLATILITPLKRLYHNVFMVIAQEDGLITEELQNRLKLGRASASICQNLDFLASDLINCREVVNLRLRELAINHLYNHPLSFTLSCLSTLVMAGVLYVFLREADRRPFLSAIDAALEVVIEGYLRANPGRLPSIRLVFSFLVISSLLAKFAAIAFLRLLTTRLSKLCLEGAIPKSTLDTLVLTVSEICELNFGLLMCKQLSLVHILVIHREVFHKIILTIEALAFLKESAMNGTLCLEERAAALLGAHLEASTTIACSFRNNLVNSDFKRFSPGFASYFLTNLALLLHTLCTYAPVISTLISVQHSIVLLKSVALQELVDSPSALVSSCRGISGYYRGLCPSASDRVGTIGQASEEKLGPCRYRLHEHFFEDIQKILSESLTTLSIRSLSLFVTYINKHEPRVWRYHSTRFIQLLVYLMQMLSTLDRAADKLIATDPLTTLPLERSIFNRQSLLGSLRERLFDFSYSLSPIALIRLTTGNDISILHGFTPGFLTIKFLESSTETLNLQKSLVLERAYNYFLEHKAVHYKLAGMLPPFDKLNDPLLGVSSDRYKTYGKILPCISFISVDPQNEVALVYCHNYNALFVYKLSPSIDDVYLVGAGSTELFDVVRPGSQILLGARVVWAEVKKGLRSYKLCEVYFILGDSPQMAAELEECIWKTTKHEKPVKRLALFSVEDEQDEYEKRQQEERHTDAKDSAPKPDKRQSYSVTQEKTVTEESIIVRLKIKKKMAH